MTGNMQCFSYLQTVEKSFFEEKTWKNAIFRISRPLQLDRVRMTLETLVRSSGPHAPPTTLRAFFDSPG